jgi:hypothetical protein
MPVEQGKVKMNNNKLISSVASVVVLFATAVGTHAQVTLLAEDFEGGNLNQWIGRSGGSDHGLIVTDPLNPTNHVLTFTDVNSGGDMFGNVPGPVNPTVQHLVLSFDFLALPIGGVVPAEYGGFAGINPDTIAPSPFWLAGTFLPEVNVPPPVQTLLATDGQWHHYSIDFTSVAAANNLTTFYVVLEDWSGFGRSIPGDVYFDNVKVTAKLDPSVIAQLVPCAGPSSGGIWKTHGAYVSAMSKATGALVLANLITPDEQSAYVSAAAQSNCGKIALQPQ